MLKIVSSKEFALFELIYITDVVVVTLFVWYMPTTFHIDTAIALDTRNIAMDATVQNAQIR